MQELDSQDNSEDDSAEADSDDFSCGTHLPTQSNPEEEESFEDHCTPLGLVDSDSRCTTCNDATTDGATVSNLSNLRQRCYLKLVGDYIDKNVKPRHMRSDNQTKSLHYFHVYAVADRVNTSQSNQRTIRDPKSVDLQVLLPSIDDERIMKENFCTLISRVLG